MKKYRMYVAEFASVITSDTATGVDYMVIVKSDDPECDYEPSSGHRFDSLEKALECAGTMDIVAKAPLIVKMPRVMNRVYQNSCEFDTESGAKRWLESQKSTQGDREYSSRIHEVRFDESELEDYEHAPCYEVTLKVQTTKLLRVEIDTSLSEYDGIEDEYDAFERARSMVEDGDLDHELEYEDVWDSDIEEYETLEN